MIYYSPQKMNPCYLPNQTYSQRIPSLSEELKINKVFFNMRNLRPSFFIKQCSINSTYSSSVLYFHKIFDPSSLLLLNRNTLVKLHYKFLSDGKTNKQTILLRPFAGETCLCYVEHGVKKVWCQWEPTQSQYLLFICNHLSTLPPTLWD